MAFDNERPVGAAAVVTRTKEINMLAGRDDLAVLWDIRVDDAYKHQGIGQRGMLMRKIHEQIERVGKSLLAENKIPNYQWTKDVDVCLYKCQDEIERHYLK